MEVNAITERIIGAGMSVHSALGPGLLESAYLGCMVHELRKRGLRVESEVALPVEYDGTRIDVGYRLDLLVENEIIVELKAVERVLPIHQAQLLTYLKLSEKPIGLLINFYVLHLRDGIKRMINAQPLRPSASSVVQTNDKDFR